MKSTKFTRSTIEGLVRSGQPCTLKDPSEKGLRVKVGIQRCVFQYEKRIAGSKGAAVTFTIGPFPTFSIEEARQEARRLATLCEKGIDPRTKDNKVTAQEINLETAINLFLEAKQGLRKNAIYSYKINIKNYFPTAWRCKKLNEITAEMIAAQFRAIHSHSPAVCWEFLKLAHNLWNTCSIMFYDKVGLPLLGENPAIRARQLLKGIRKTMPRRSVINITAVGKFVVTAENIINRSVKNWPHRKITQLDTQMAEVAILSLFTGFRFNELRHLRWGNVNLEEGYLFLSGKASENGSFQGTKNHQDHYIGLSTHAWDFLKAIQNRRTADSPYVFPGKNPLTPCARSERVFKFLSQQIGSHYSPHASRRTFASIADEIGLGFLTVKRLLNHSFVGGVTGGYVVAGFNPVKERVNFQKVCDYILDQRAIYLGEDQESARLERLKRYAIELGFEPAEALRRLTQLA